jgi:phosphoribosylformylglycinamidine synthase
VVDAKGRGVAAQAGFGKVNAIVLRAAGTNCDEETAHAFELAGAAAERVHIFRLVEHPEELRSYQILAIPGGFTYGDDIAAGKILANELRFRLGSEVRRFIDDGKLVLGICNGFQVLVKAGLLPGWAGRQEVTLTWNDTGRYEDRWVHLRTEHGSPCVFTAGLEDRILYLPVAHAEGKFVTAGRGPLSRLNSRRQVVFRYVTGEGGRAGYPDNPNGSTEGIAGICDDTGRVLGLMPHPERCVSPLSHPRWTRGGLAGPGAGLQLFTNAVAYARRNLS